jgi:peptidoglycan/LPS O-acetylase OafA/YrhL
MPKSVALCRPSIDHTPNRSSRYDFIDSLRGMAAISVLYLHSADLLMRGGYATNRFEISIMSAMVRFVDVGKVGVIVFFAISGFVIPGALLKSGYSSTRFIINRICRLYPAYWLSILLALYVFYYLAGHHASLLMVAINFTMLQQFFGQDNIMDVYWTLQIELTFYAFCLLAFKLGYLSDSTKLLWISLSFLGIGLALSAFRFATHLKLPVAMPLGLSVMFWGAILRSYRTEGSKHAGQLSHWIFAAYVMVIPVISILAYNFDAGFDETWYRYTASYLSAIAIFYALTGTLKISGRLLSWLGRISYSVYLFHPLFVNLTIAYIVPFYPHPPFVHLYIALILCFTLIFCTFTYAYVEAPFITLSRVLGEYLDSNSRWGLRSLDPDLK